MSDTSHGPGWWMASDGRWYPPHLSPWTQSRPVDPGWWQAPDGNWYPQSPGQAPATGLRPNSQSGQRSSKWGVIAAIAGVVFFIVAIGGVILVSHLPAISDSEARGGLNEGLDLTRLKCLQLRSCAYVNPSVMQSYATQFTWLPGSTQSTSSTTISLVTTDQQAMLAVRSATGTCWVGVFVTTSSAAAMLRTPGIGMFFYGAHMSTCSATSVAPGRWRRNYPATQ